MKIEDEERKGHGRTLNVQRRTSDVPARVGWLGMMQNGESRGAMATGAGAELGRKKIDAKNGRRIVLDSLTFMGFGDKVLPCGSRVFGTTIAPDAVGL